MIYLATDFLTEKLSQEVVGQEEALWKLVRAILENLENFATGKGGKKNVLLTGPTGSGKSEVARRLGELFKVPFIRVSITDYTLTGYKGRDPQDILLEDFKGEYERKKEEFKEFLIGVLTYYEALKYAKELPLEEKLELARFGALLCFAEPQEIENPPKRADFFLSMLKSLEGNEEIEAKAKELLKGPPFGIVFIDEFDKVLIDESQNNFYQHLQSHILTMVEGGLVTKEKRKAMESSNVTFVLAGSFYHASPEELTPELKGRLQVEVNFKKLELEDYERIAKKLFSRGELPGLLGEVEAEESFFKELARVCRLENQKEYLGARRLQKLLTKVEEALNWEFSRAPSEVKLTGQFLKWAVEFTLPPLDRSEVLLKPQGQEKKPLEVAEAFLKFLKDKGPITVNDENFEKYRWLLSEVDEEGKSLLLKAHEEGLVTVSLREKKLLELEVGKGKKVMDINVPPEDDFPEEEIEEFLNEEVDQDLLDILDEIEF